ncbi:MAG: hypothetical protein FJ102_20020 [Deltaproteobacteria bacterium]|nr:hypothetical protein [Deltaproteobacteria bacterium]
MSRQLIDVLPGVAVTTVLGGGLAGLCFNESLLVSPGKTWWNGDWGVAYEDALDEEFVVRQPSIELFGIVEWSLFGEGRRGVVVGEEGWLFTAEEFELYPGAMQRAETRARRVAEVQAEMAKRGTALLVAYLPSKARVEADHLGGHRVPAEVAAVGPRFVQGLRAAGVDVLELEGALESVEGDAFLHTDTHWTPAGARAVAAMLAEHVKEGGADWVGGATVTLGEGAPGPHEGDLLRYVPLGPLQAQLGPALDTLATPAATVESGGGLLGDVTIPVAVVGTSYSEDKRWGFVAGLQAELQADVLNAARQGQGPFVAMDAYLADEAWTEAPPRLVIWEIPERYVGMEE